MRIGDWRPWTTDAAASLVKGWLGIGDLLRAATRRVGHCPGRHCGSAVAFGFMAMFMVSAAAAQQQVPSRTNLTFNHYYSYEEMTAALHQLVAAYPELLSIRSIGKSYEGRDLWVVTVNNPKTGADTDKRAMYIDGNIHGNEIEGSEVPLYTLWYLTKGYGVIEAITRLLDDRAFYVLPMVNPDGRAYWFNQPNSANSSRSGMKPVDDDNDGLFDEDPPDDLDGDGNIVQMRRLDPNGRMRPSPEDPRLMVRIELGERYDGPRYTLLGSEGIDNDGDGLINEDGPGGYDMNRNWPGYWQPEYIQDGAGDFPLSYPETRAITAFVLAHTNISAVQSYHNSGGMILRGPGAQYPGEYPFPDVRVYDVLGRRGEAMLPFYRYMVIWSDLYTVHGGFVNWTYEGLGIFSFTNELWSDAQPYNRREPGETPKERLEFDDFLLFGQTYVKWKPFKHPQYGDIELGGFTKYGSRIPPPFMLEETCHRNAAFTIYHAEQMPRLEVSDVEVKRLDGDLLEVTVEVKNTRIIPTVSAQAAEHGIGRRDSIELLAGEGGEVKVLAGGALADRFGAPLQFVEHQPVRLWVDTGIPGESARLFRWIVRGSGSARVRYFSERGGRAERTFPLAEIAR